MIARRRCLVCIALGLFAAQAHAETQRPTKIPRIGILWPGADDPTLQAFQRALRDLGYVDGTNIAVEYRFARDKDDLLPGLAEELVRLKVDVIVTWGVVAARAAKRATTTIPIVNGSMSDPVGAGLVASLARPGGNLMGLTSLSRELSGKRLELLREIVPGLSRVAALATPNPTAMFGLKETEAAARSLGLRLQAVSVRDAADFAGAFAAMARERAEALVVLPDLTFYHHLKTIVELAANYRLPAMYWSKEYVAAGGLMSYAPSISEMFRRAAAYVDQILKGADPATLPIEQPTKFELVINLKTAKALGIEVPRSFLARADEVIE